MTFLVDPWVAASCSTPTTRSTRCRVSAKTYYCRTCAEKSAIYNFYQLPSATELTSSIQQEKEIKHVSGSLGSPLNSVFKDGYEYRASYTLTAGSGSIEHDPGRSAGQELAIVLFGAATKSIREEYGQRSGFHEAFKIVLPLFPAATHLIGTGSAELSGAVCQICGEPLF